MSQRYLFPVPEGLACGRGYPEEGDHGPEPGVRVMAMAAGTL